MSENSIMTIADFHISEMTAETAAAIELHNSIVSAMKRANSGPSRLSAGFFIPSMAASGIVIVMRSSPGQAGVIPISKPQAKTALSFGRQTS